MEKLKKALKENRYSIKLVVEALGCSRGAWYKKLEKPSRFNQSDILVLASLSKLSIKEVKEEIEKGK